MIALKKLYKNFVKDHKGNAEKGNNKQATPKTINTFFKQCKLYA